jgi:hypothetical protein
MGALVPRTNDMRTAIASFLLVVAPYCLWAFQPSIERVNITNFGIYALQVKKGGHGGSPSERSWDVVTKLRRLNSTTTIPARLCISFGFEYVIVGTPGWR